MHPSDAADPQPRPFSLANGATYADPDPFTGLLAYADPADAAAERNADARPIAYVSPATGRDRQLP